MQPRPQPRLRLGPLPRGQPAEQRQLEPMADFLGRPNACIERIPEECERDTEYESEAEAEHDVAHRAWPDLGGAVCCANEGRIGRLQRLEGAELLLLLDQAGVEGRAPVVLCVQLPDSSSDFPGRSLERGGVELQPVDGELSCVRGRKSRSRARVAVIDVEYEEIGVGLWRGARVGEQIGWSPILYPRRRERTARHLRTAGQIGL